MLVLYQRPRFESVEWSFRLPDFFLGVSNNFHLYLFFLDFRVNFVQLLCYWTTRARLALLLENMYNNMRIRVHSTENTSFIFMTFICYKRGYAYVIIYVQIHTYTFICIYFIKWLTVVSACDDDNNLERILFILFRTLLASSTDYQNDPLTPTNR